MPEISNEALSLSCQDDGTGTVLVDKKRGTRWVLDERTRLYHAGADFRFPGDNFQPIGPGTAKVTGSGVLEQQFGIKGERVIYRWNLLSDGVDVELSFERGGEQFALIALPGCFNPEGERVRRAVPIMQGVLFERRGGGPFQWSQTHAAHEGFSMAMVGYLAQTGGMTAVVEDIADWVGTVGQWETGPAYAYIYARESLRAMRYTRHIRLYLTDPSLTAVCKKYRARILERGEFKPWEEKIAERPVVDRLFGALMTFIGYNQSEIDYVAECRKLKAYGFDRAFIYPVRFNTYTQDFKMGGDAPIWLSDETIHQIKELGYDVAPWTWIFEGLDDGSEAMQQRFKRKKNGDLVPCWKIDNYQWYVCCTPAQVDFARKAYEGPMQDMTWNHYDVSATAYSADTGECYALDHPGHLGHAKDRRTDRAFLRDLLGNVANGNRVISSEGFVDAFSTSYDIGSTKYDPAWGSASCWTVPMTMLVYHDSVIHDCWEGHNYNGEIKFKMQHKFGAATNGSPKDKAIRDALYGCPPNVFPFGRQYRWVDFEARKTAAFEYHFEDAEVQEALACALPVAKHHRKIGKLELLSHDFLSEDGAVQETVFADGTRVVANFADEPRDTGEGNPLAVKSWKSVE